MTAFSGSKTEQNLLKAFAGESQARNRYTFFSKVAKKEGFEQIAAIFLETAEQERSHAKIFYRFLDGGPVEITASFRAGKIGNTYENLLAAAEGENEENSFLYRNFSKTAFDEGFVKVGAMFKMIADIEALHENRFRKLLENIQKNEVFVKSEKVKWVCRVCGFEHNGTEAPDDCPVCNHPKGYFEIKAENF